MLIFHIAEVSRWDAAQLAGSYAQSTLGRSLEDEGFIHAAREDQVEDVRRRYYADVTQPLVLLTIDTDKLTSPWQEDVVGDVTFPHVYGPINPSAVVATRSLSEPEAAAEQPERAPSRSFLELFLAEMTFRMFLAVGVMALGAACFALGSALAGDTGAAVGIVLGLVVGVIAAVAVARRRDARLAPTG